MLDGAGEEAVLATGRGDWRRLVGVIVWDEMESGDGTWSMQTKRDVDEMRRGLWRCEDVVVGSGCLVVAGGGCFA